MVCRPLPPRRVRWAKRTFSAIALAVIAGLAMVRGAVAQNANERPDTTTTTEAGQTTEATGSLVLGGNGLPAPRRLEIAELRSFPRAEVRVTQPPHGGDGSQEVFVYAGIPLAEVLKAAGLRLDPDMAGIRRTVTGSVLVEAADGYQAVFALAELDPALTDRVVLLADTRDGQPLGPKEGPWRLVVPGDKRPARWVRQVTAVTVRRN